MRSNHEIESGHWRSQDRVLRRQPTGGSPARGRSESWSSCGASSRSTNGENREDVELHARSAQNRLPAMNEYSAALRVVRLTSSVLIVYDGLGDSVVRRPGHRGAVPWET